MRFTTLRVGTDIHQIEGHGLQSGQPVGAPMIRRLAPPSRSIVSSLAAIA
ncbi:hypothetical protein [Xanthomonas prunicola]|uniref:Uncharacterized protein n=1 Tax=Xanthomonas prunicola TaxID=2053930 RepID=A0A9Q9J5K3_9XANT|nr:hypothetical protein [Xanthomonas prunicola]UXA50302.1 hypothetical protein M0D44_07210 [Xanthomonas prunicola]UXA58608.1 hypothetical protein M0D47_07250 [Xanthomonas prunicola]UXA60752.1 hypothetical protein M0D48_17535 [Xanthomonas prunicola]UXA66818.1 hypothetical protein M0D43_07465 [Xanthomonas prunicola]